jgi:hypothetical protein
VNAEKKLTLTSINGGYDGPPSRVFRVPAWQRLRLHSGGAFEVAFQINGEAQGVIHLVFDRRPIGRE